MGEATVFCYGEGMTFPTSQFSADLALHERPPRGKPHFRVTGVPTEGELRVHPLPAALSNDAIDTYRTKLKTMFDEETSGGVEERERG